MTVITIATARSESKEHECRRRSAEKKILQGSFSRLGAALVEGRKDVKRQAQQFQRNEDQKNILRTHQEHHAGRRKQNEGQIFADMRGEGRLHRYQNYKDR